MRIIDLTLPMYTGMPVYPGDVEASIEPVQTLEKNGWEVRRLQIHSHDGTHVNVPAHGVAGGKRLDEYSLDDFCGKAVIYENAWSLTTDVGVIFRDQNIDTAIAQNIKVARPRFVGLSSTFEFDVDIERDLLAAGIISYEQLANVEQLPQEFMFYGMPLHIRDGDGSPVRAFATFE